MPQKWFSSLFPSYLKKKEEGEEARAGGWEKENNLKVDI